MNPDAVMRHLGGRPDSQRPRARPPRSRAAACMAAGCNSGRSASCSTATPHLPSETKSSMLQYIRRRPATESMRPAGSATVPRARRRPAPAGERRGAQSMSASASLWPARAGGRRRGHWGQAKARAAASGASGATASMIVYAGQAVSRSRLGDGVIRTGRPSQGARPPMRPRRWQARRLGACNGPGGRAGSGPGGRSDGSRQPQRPLGCPVSAGRGWHPQAHRQWLVVSQY